MFLYMFRRWACQLERQVLVIFPHPDDETLAVGGAIALHAQTGAPVTYACFTLGQMGRNMGNPFFATRETLPDIRAQELREACAILGIGDVRLLGFRDKTLEFEDPELLIRLIRDLLKELQPSLVITYYPGYCVHPDHEALAAATVEAIRRLPTEERPVLQCQAFSNNHRDDLGAPDVVLDTHSVWETRMNAIRAHKSQTAFWVGQMEAALSSGAKERADVLNRLNTETMYTFSFK